MKKIILGFCLSLLSVSLFGENLIVLSLDFNVNQIDINPPLQGYYAAYLINTTNHIITFGDSAIQSWLGTIYGYSEGTGRSLRVFDVRLRRFTEFPLILQPNGRVILYSQAFAERIRQEYIYSYLFGDVIINNRNTEMIAYFYPDLN